MWQEEVMTTTVAVRRLQSSFVPGPPHVSRQYQVEGPPIVPGLPHVLPPLSPQVTSICDAVNILIPELIRQEGNERPVLRLVP